MESLVVRAPTGSAPQLPKCIFRMSAMKRGSDTLVQSTTRETAQLSNGDLAEGHPDVHCYFRGRNRSS